MFDQIPPHFACQRHAITTLIFQSLARNPTFRCNSNKGRLRAREKEQNRIIEAYHEEMFSSMIAVLFLIETAKSELEEAGLPQPKAVSKLLYILAETTEKIAEACQKADKSDPCELKDGVHRSGFLTLCLLIVSVISRLSSWKIMTTHEDICGSFWITWVQMSWWQRMRLKA